MLINYIIFSDCLKKWLYAPKRRHSYSPINSGSNEASNLFDKRTVDEERKKNSQQ